MVPFFLRGIFKFKAMPIPLLTFAFVVNQSMEVEGVGVRVVSQFPAVR